jgi:hypothetical protein
MRALADDCDGIAMCDIRTNNENAVRCEGEAGPQIWTDGVNARIVFRDLKELGGRTAHAARTDRMGNN